MLSMVLGGVECRERTYLRFICITAKPLHPPPNPSDQKYVLIFQSMIEVKWLISVWEHLTASEHMVILFSKILGSPRRS